MKKLLYVILLTFCVSGCGIIAFTGVVAVGTVGAIGYGISEAGGAIAGRTKKRAGQVAKLFEDGAVVAEEPYSVEVTWTAMKSVLTELKLRDIRGQYDLLSGFLTASTHKGTRVEIALRVIDDGTEISMLVGEAGDTEQSKIILDKLAQKLAPLKPIKKVAGVTP